MKTVTLNVMGMHCRSCEMLIQDMLEDLEGVYNIKVSYENATAKVEFDESKINIEKIKSLITSNGYKAE